MRRERLLSGQRWYFDDDGTSVTLDLVVDIWDTAKAKVTSNVMIGGLWYSEDTIQQMISERRNSCYTVIGDAWNYDKVNSDYKAIVSAIEHEAQRYQPFELEHDPVISDIIASVTEQLLEDPYGTVRSVTKDCGSGLVFGDNDDVMFHLSSIVRNVLTVKKTVSVC